MNITRIICISITLQNTKLSLSFPLNIRHKSLLSHVQTATKAEKRRNKTIMDLVLFQPYVDCGNNIPVLPVQSQSVPQVKAKLNPIWKIIDSGERLYLKTLSDIKLGRNL